MKKIILLGFTIAILASCKDNVKVESVEVFKSDSINTEVIDTIQLKKQIAKEKESLVKPYNETEDAQVKINELLALAKSEGKNVFVQAGGNWCIWCLRFNNFVQSNPEIKSIVDENFVYYHLNYSSANKNEAIFEKYVPDGKKLGFPFFFVLNAKGEVINVIGSEKLEADKSYDLIKVKQMFIDNSPLK